MDWARQIHIKTPAEIEIMREAGRINAAAHAAVKELLQPGVTTADLNAAAEEVLRYSIVFPQHFLSSRVEVGCGNTWL